MDLFLQDSHHPIFELELLPVLAAVLLWAKYVQNSQCVFYLGNEAAKGALIHGATSPEKGMRIIEKFVLDFLKKQSIDRERLHANFRLSMREAIQQL